MIRQVLVLGVDGGNTKTVALVAQLDGAIVGAGRAGCGDIYGVKSAAGAVGEVEAAVDQALKMAGAGPESLVAGLFSMAGADWPEDFTLLQTEMERRGYGRTVVVVNDAIGALRAGSPDGFGVVVACGTGAAVGARSAPDSLWHTSFWQEPGGASDLGRQALRAIFRAELELDPPTALTGRVLGYHRLTSVEELLHLYTARGRQHPSAGALAPLLLDEAGKGDTPARRIVQGHGASLGDYAAVAARKVGLQNTPFTLVLAGGVLRHPSPLLGEAILARVRTTSPDALSVNSRFEPAVGALFLALETAGARVDEDLLQRMTPTLPPVALFATST